MATKREEKIKEIEEKLEQVLGKEPKVSIKKFEAKYVLLRDYLNNPNVSGEGKDIEKELDKDIGDKEVEILPLLVTKNVYILPVLATLSMILKALKSKIKQTPDKVKVNFLIGKEVVRYSEFIRKPFEESYKHIIDVTDEIIQTIINIDFSDTKSLLNLILTGMELEEVNIKDFVLNHVDYKDLDEYLKERNIKIDNKIKNWVNKRGKKQILRVKDVIFNEKYNIAEKLLGILINFLQSERDNKNGGEYYLRTDKNKILILIVAEPVKETIKKYPFNNRNVDGNLFSNIIIAWYINIITDKDPEILQNEIPSYLNLLSKYLNSKEVVYAIDEYCYPMMMEKIGRRFKCEKFHEEIREGHERYEKRKRDFIKAFIDDPFGEDTATRKSYIEIIEDYLKKQRKTLEAMNNGFLAVQEGILEQLRFIL